VESFFTGYDPVTLEERFDVTGAEHRLEELADRRGLAELVEKIGLLRITGDPDAALEVANEAARQARFAGDREPVLQVRIARAQVLRVQGKLDQAMQDLSTAIIEAEAADLWQIVAEARRQRALVKIALDDLHGARDDFNEALVVLVREHAGPTDIDSTMIALGALLDRAGSSAPEA